MGDIALNILLTFTAVLLILDAVYNNRSQHDHTVYSSGSHPGPSGP